MGYLKLNATDNNDSIIRRINHMMRGVATIDPINAIYKYRKSRYEDSIDIRSFYYEGVNYLLTPSIYISNTFIEDSGFIDITSTIEQVCKDMNKSFSDSLVLFKESQETRKNLILNRIKERPRDIRYDIPINYYELLSDSRKLTEDAKIRNSNIQNEIDRLKVELENMKLVREKLEKDILYFLVLSNHLQQTINLGRIL